MLQQERHTLHVHMYIVHTSFHSSTQAIMHT